MYNIFYTLRLFFLLQAARANLEYVHFEMGTHFIQKEAFAPSPNCNFIIIFLFRSVHIKAKISLCNLCLCFFLSLDHIFTKSFYLEIVRVVWKRNAHCYGNEKADADEFIFLPQSFQASSQKFHWQRQIFPVNH